MMIKITNRKKIFFSPVRTIVAIGIMAMVAIVTQNDSAQAAKVLKKVKDWTLYQHGQGVDRLCFISAVPKTKKPKRVRGPVRFYVSSWPGQGIENEVSVLIGYRFAEDAVPEVKVDRKSFKMSKKGRRAYIDDPDLERQLVAAMRSGSVMTVYGKSRRGTKTADTYSLSGVTAALAEMKRRCQ